MTAALRPFALPEACAMAQPERLDGGALRAELRARVNVQLASGVF